MRCCKRRIGKKCWGFERVEEFWMIEREFYKYQVSCLNGLNSAVNWKTD